MHYMFIAIIIAIMGNSVFGKMRKKLQNATCVNQIVELIKELYRSEKIEIKK